MDLLQKATQLSLRTWRKPAMSSTADSLGDDFQMTVGGQRSGCWLEKDHAENLDRGAGSAATGACAGATGGLDTAKTNQDAERGSDDTNVGDESGATCADKTVRFQD
eukprot:295566-Amphidinium_carterae.1